MQWLRTLGVAGTLLLGLATSAGAVDDGDGKDWRRLDETSITGLSWEQLAALCPTDGATTCGSGLLGSVRMKDWVWATSPQVLALFGRYVPALAQSGASSIFGAEIAAPAAAAQAAFGITFASRGCPTYQPCWNFRDAVGLTASVVSAGPPANAIGGYIGLDLEWGTGNFSIYSPIHPSTPRGAWMWRPTGLHTGQVHAYDDAGTPAAGSDIAVADVMANDWVAGQRATLANATLAQLSSSTAGLWLDPATGAVRVDPGTAAGSHELIYRLCSRAQPSRCDDALVSVTIRSYPLVARNDLGAVSMGAGGRAITNVLANDLVGTTTASPASVQLSQVSTTHPGVVLNTATGSVDVAAGTPHGTHSLVYRICERANPVNCAQATATVTPFTIDAVNDAARASSKTGGVAIANVLANDWFNGARATLAQVAISLPAPLPKGITLDVGTGAVTVKPKTDSGTYVLNYTICERLSPTNCDTATITLDLSGRSP